LRSQIQKTATKNSKSISPMARPSRFEPETISVRATTRPPPVSNFFLSRHFRRHQGRPSTTLAGGVLRLLDVPNGPIVRVRSSEFLQRSLNDAEFRDEPGRSAGAINALKKSPPWLPRPLPEMAHGHPVRRDFSRVEQKKTNCQGNWILIQLVAAGFIFPPSFSLLPSVISRSPFCVFLESVSWE